jgi:hypothetical protein
MKERLTSCILVACGLLAGAILLLTRSAPALAEELLVPGRPVHDWVNEVALGHALSQTNKAEEVLITSGPHVVPALCQLLVGTESVKDLAMSLPFVPADVRDMNSITSQTLLLKTKAASVLGAIAYRNPSAPEVQSAVPYLTRGLESSSLEIRFRCAQALGAIGKGASSGIPTLVKSARNEDSGVRMCAVEALGRIGIPSPVVIQTVTKALADTNSDVRVTAKETLKILSTEK